MGFDDFCMQVQCEEYYQEDSIAAQLEDFYNSPILRLRDDQDEE